MSFIRKRKFISVILTLVVVLLIASILIVKFETKDSSRDVSEQNTADSPADTRDTVTIDYNGDGIDEKFVVTKENGKIDMTAFDSGGYKVANLKNVIALYPTTLYEIVKLNENSDKEYLQWNMPVGPHHVETVFLTVVEGMIHPIYSIDFGNNTMYSPFYTSRGTIVVEDTNYDGLKEIIENVDEYPEDAPRMDGPEIEQMIRESFDAKNVDEFIKIVKRENNGEGRGRKVIMSVHTFIDAEVPFFRKLPEDEYNEIADKLVKASEIVSENFGENEYVEGGLFLKYDDLSQDSKDFNEFVRAFWTHGREHTRPIPEE